MIEIKGKFTTAKVMIDDVEPSCMAQISHFTNHPAFTNPIVIQPDCHAGKGSCIGFTMEMTDKIIPNVIGVDLSCGMLSLNFGEISFSKEQLAQLDYKIRKTIPFGVNIHDRPILQMKNFPWKKANVLAEKFSMAYQNKFDVSITPPRYDIRWFENKCKSIGGNIGRFINSLGTLGGSNHFVEVGKSQTNDIWITIHSGSRNFGLKICNYWQNKAKKILKNDKRDILNQKIKEIKETFSSSQIKQEITKAKTELDLNHNINLKDSEWLEGEDATNYLFDMLFAQVYADINRELMANSILNLVQTDIIDKILTTHNFIDFNDLIIRKGAIRSYKGERMIIPFNMQDGILICEGKSNPEWNYSAPHGAGRLMSRSKAKKTLDLEKFKDQMKDIYSTSVDQSTLDEAPGAYKDPKIIENLIEPTATIIDKIKPILSMKNGEAFIRKKGKK